VGYSRRDWRQLLRHQAAVLVGAAPNGLFTGKRMRE
jgi:hypothetical protein